MENMKNGLAICVDVDNADPRKALRVLSGLLGPPTVVVNTGSVWTSRKRTASTRSADPCSSQAGARRRTSTRAALVTTLRSSSPRFATSGRRGASPRPAVKPES